MCFLCCNTLAICLLQEYIKNPNDKLSHREGSSLGQLRLSSSVLEPENPRNAMCDPGQIAESKQCATVEVMFYVLYAERTFIIRSSLWLLVWMGDIPVCMQFRARQHTLRSPLELKVSHLSSVSRGTSIIVYINVVRSISYRGPTLEAHQPLLNLSLGSGSQSLFGEASRHPDTPH